MKEAPYLEQALVVASALKLHELLMKPNSVPSEHAPALALAHGLLPMRRSVTNTCTRLLTGWPRAKAQSAIQKKQGWCARPGPSGPGRSRRAFRRMRMMGEDLSRHHRCKPPAYRAPGADQVAACGLFQGQYLRGRRSSGTVQQPAVQAPELGAVQGAVAGQGDHEPAVLSHGSSARKARRPRCRCSDSPAGRPAGRRSGRLFNPSAIGPVTWPLPWFSQCPQTEMW